MYSIKYDDIKKSYDSSITGRINKTKFYDVMNRVYGFDMTKVMYIKSLGPEKIEYFNACLRQAKDYIKVDIYSMILFMEGDFENLNILLSVIDQRNKQIIKEELADEYGINYSNNVLPEIIW
jgi:hypothetical protein